MEKFEGSSDQQFVVLVHGTWGRGFLPFLRAAIAPWCEENSDLRKSISSALGKDTFYEVFNWSGANTPGARLKAANLLANTLIKTRETNPTAKIHLVAHSHGGNVVLYALSNPRVRNMVSSSVFLSTPFLHVRPRLMGVQFGRQIESLAALLALFIGFNAMFYIIGSYDSWGCLLALLTALASVLTAALAPLLLRRLHSWSHRFAGRMTLPEELPFPSLIIRGSADEAASALGGAQFLSILLTKIFRLLLLLFPPFQKSAAISGELLERLLKICLLIMLVCFIVSLLWAALLPPIDGVPVEGNPACFLTIVAAAMLFVLPFFVLVFTPLLGMLVAILLALVLLPFGAQNMLAALSVHISAEATPPGKWTVVQLAPSSLTFEEERGLRHFTHSNKDALCVVESWLVEVRRSVNEVGG